VLWSLVHHLFAGIRFLLLDIDIGIGRQAATRSAWLVIIAELVSVGLLLGALL
jgi:succinate dehydrogenase / fumarate reductase cytochrome b subunit